MLEFFERGLEVGNIIIAIGVIFLGIRAAPTLTLTLQRRSAQFFLAATLFFALSEILAVADFLLALKDVELYRELSETGFISCVAIALYIMGESERREVTLLRRWAEIDALTMLYNHAYFRRAAQRRFEQARKYNLPLSIILLDIDNFKAYNDQFGHEAGNVVLRSIAQTLRESARADDLIARYGGEEFVVVMSDTLQDALIAAERIRVNVETQCSPNYNPMFRRRITVSLGVATLSHETGSLEELIEAADKQMYRAKKAGRNCIRADGLL